MIEVHVADITEPDALEAACHGAWYVSMNTGRCVSIVIDLPRVRYVQTISPAHNVKRIKKNARDFLAVAKVFWT